MLFYAAAGSFTAFKKKIPPERFSVQATLSFSLSNLQFMVLKFTSTNKNEQLVGKLCLQCVNFAVALIVFKSTETKE